MLMTELRPATSHDANAIAKIMQDWLDETPWIPDLHSLDETVAFCRDTLIGKYQTTVIGDPPKGFVSVEPDNTIAALYVAPTSKGTGSALLANAQATHHHLGLWVFQQNTNAIRFYQRHGFRETERTDGDNAEKLPDIRMEWHA